MRKFPRVRIQFQADYSSGRRKSRHRVWNLGGGGLFIHSPRPLKVGSELVLCFRPTGKPPALRVKAKVRYNLPGKGFGVEFVKISRAKREVILRLVHRRTFGRRKQARVPLVAQIEFGKKQPLGWVKDISLGGLFVETNKPPGPGTQVIVRFNLPSQDAITSARCEVTYSLRALGMGLQFVEISEEDLSFIQAYIQKHVRQGSKGKKGLLPLLRPAESGAGLKRAPGPASKTPTGFDRNP